MATFDGLQEPEEVKAATQTYREEMDLLSLFLEECCEVGTGMVPAGDLYDAYEKWCNKNGEQPVTKRTFGRMMGERGLRAENKSCNGETKRCYLGLSLNF